MKKTSSIVIALTAAFGLFMSVLDTTIINVALVPMSNSLQASLSSVQWVITGYFLAQAAVIPVAGYLSLRFGVKRLFLASLIFFTLGSLLCGLSGSLGLLIAFRVLQGLGGGALFPIAQTISNAAFPPEKRAVATSIVAIPVLFAPAIGPTLGGILTDAFGWQSIFFVNVPIGILAVFLGLRNVPEDNLTQNAARRGFDFLGLFLCISGVLAITYAFALVSETQPGTESKAKPRGDIYGWGYWPVWVLLTIGIVLVIAFGVYALRFSRDPVLDLRLFKARDFAMGNMIVYLFSLLFFGSVIAIPVFWQQIHLPHFSATEAGLVMMPQGLASVAGVAISGRLYNRIGPRGLIAAASFLLIIGTWRWTTLTNDMGWVDLLPWLLVRGLGFGGLFVPAQTLALRVIPVAALAKATSLLSVVRQLFSSIGVAIVTSILVQQTASHAATLQQTSHDPVQLISQAGTAATNDVFTFVTLGFVILLLLALVLPGRPKQPKVEQGAAREAKLTEAALVAE